MLKYLLLYKSLGINQWEKDIGERIIITHTLFINLFWNNSCFRNFRSHFIRKASVKSQNPFCLLKNIYFWKPSISLESITVGLHDLGSVLILVGPSLVAQTLKNLPVMQEIQVWSLVWEDLLESEMATHTYIRAWEIPWTEEPGGLQTMWWQSQTQLSE